MLDELEMLVDVLNHPGFMRGLVAGLIVGGIILLPALILKRSVPGWGLLFAAAAAYGLAVEQSLLTRLAILAGAGLLVDLVSLYNPSLATKALRALAWLAVIPAVVWFTAGTGIEEPSWVPIAYPLMVATLGAGIWLLGRSLSADLVGPLLAISVAGAWVTVPETDTFTVILGVALALGLATLSPIRGRPLAAGALAVAGLFAWLVLDGGEPRLWTVVGAWAAAATLPVVALVEMLRARPPGLVWTFVTHVVYVVAVTRVADHTESPLVVLVGFAVLISMAGITIWLLPTPMGSETSPSNRP